MKLYWKEKTQSIIALIGEEIWVDMRSGRIIPEPSGTIARLNEMAGSPRTEKFKNVNLRLFKNWQKNNNVYSFDNLFLLIEKKENEYLITGSFPKYFFKSLMKIMPC